MNIIKITKGSGRVVFFRRFYLRALISFHRRNHRGKRLNIFMIYNRFVRPLLYLKKIIHAT